VDRNEESGMSVWMSMVARRLAAVAVVTLVASGYVAGFAKASTSPGGRAYEMVSPPAKNGADVMADSGRTRVSADGNAVSFASLTGFGDVIGAGIGTEYMSQRSSLADPGDNGWRTHAITPRQEPLTVFGGFHGLDSAYAGEFSDDLSAGVFRAWSPVTAAPNVEHTENLYVRTDLRTAGDGSYQLVTDSGSPLGVIFPTPVPAFAGASSDFSRVVFESRLNLVPSASGERPKAYLWDHGVVSLPGILPNGTAALCQSDGSMCSSIGQGSFNGSYTQLERSISADGRRISFIAPTDEGSRTGTLYQRVDGTQTIQLNASERTDCAGDPSCGTDGVPDPAPDPAGTRPAKYWWASVDGRRVFFTTEEQLTDDDDNPIGDLYMYDATARAGAHLTRISRADDTLDTPGETEGVVGASSDGHYVYFITVGLLVTGTSGLGGVNRGLYVWHDGERRLVAPFPNADGEDVLFNMPAIFIGARYDARVTPDGLHLLFTSSSGRGLLSLRGGVDYDHAGFRQKYLYSFATDELECASCNPTGAPGTAHALATVRTASGAAATAGHVNHSLSDDGRYVFFSTSAALAPEDRNGKTDVYEYDATAKRLQLVSSGRSTADSYFLDASPSGRDVFVSTRERLAGWDTDSNYDLYDARIGGGFPEPPAPRVECTGPACRTQASTAPASRTGTSSVAQGTGNAPGRLKVCRHRFVKKRIRGKIRCVKRKRAHSRRRRGPSRSRRAK
jgi:hypothetical protein